MKKLRTIMALTGFLIFGASAVTSAGTALAYNPLDTACKGSSSEVCKNKNESVQPVIKTVVNVLLYVVGILSVIMIIVAGIMYTISGGDTGKVTKAKNMLTYSIVGLVVSVIAYAIVNWVLSLLK